MFLKKSLYLHCNQQNLIKLFTFYPYSTFNISQCAINNMRMYLLKITPILSESIQQQQLLQNNNNYKH